MDWRSAQHEESTVVPFDSDNLAVQARGEAHGGETTFVPTLLGSVIFVSFK